MEARECQACCDCGHTHSATSAHVDLAIDNNATWQDAFQFGEPSDGTWNLAGQGFLMNVKLSYYDSTPLLVLQTLDGTIVVDDIMQRVIHFNVDDNVIQAALNPGAYVYDLVMQDNSTPPIRTPLMHGTVCVSQGVTT